MKSTSPVRLDCGYTNSLQVLKAVCGELCQSVQ